MRTEARQVRNPPPLKSTGHVLWQTLGLLAVWVYLWSLHPNNDGLWFQAGINPAVPREWVFPETATERLLAAEQGPYRLFAEPDDVMPPNTGLVQGLRSSADESHAELEYRLREVAGRWLIVAMRADGADGLGVERTVAWICGLDHLREAIAFPRLMTRLKP